jgi:hypothetical protein
MEDYMRRFLSALATAAIATSLLSGTVIASHAITEDTVAPASLDHETVPGNPRCGSAPEGGFNLKIEADDLHVGNYGPINITAVSGKYVGWEIHPDYLHTFDANLVIVKGGPNAVIYEYGTLEDSDVRLTAPRNYNGAQPKYYGISHIQFCFDPKAVSED